MKRVSPNKNQNREEPNRQNIMKDVISQKVFFIKRVRLSIPCRVRIDTYFDFVHS